MKRNKFLIFLIVIFTFQLALLSLRLSAVTLSKAEGAEADEAKYPKGAEYPKGTISAKVADISDRDYEKAVICLLDNAKDSIIISMYSISLGEGEKNPVKLLLNDLLEARMRGVSVTMYLNARFSDDGMKQSFIKSSLFKELEKAGCKIYQIPRTRMLHDKLIIVDNRYVVVGSTNWSNSALRRNFECNTLIDSPDHAKEKLKHLDDVLKFVKSSSEITHSKFYIEDLPKELFISKKLLMNEKYFSSMLTRQDERAFDLYLLLLAHSQAREEREFYINLEDMGLCLGLPGEWDYTALRRQTIKSLKRLENNYNLITVKFLHGKDAHIAFNSNVSASGQSYFTIPTNTIINTVIASEAKQSQLTMRLKFLLLIEAFLKSGGEDLHSIPKPAIAKRFSVDKTTIYDAFNDLREHTD